MLPLPWPLVDIMPYSERVRMHVQGPCPNCGKETQQYFGDILTIKGSRDKNVVECSNCKAKIEIDAETRMVCPSCSRMRCCCSQCCVLACVPVHSVVSQVAVIGCWCHMLNKIAL